MANSSTREYYQLKIVGLNNECCGPFVKKGDILRLVETKVMVNGKEERAAKAIRVSSSRRPARDTIVPRSMRRVSARTVTMLTVI